MSLLAEIILQPAPAKMSADTIAAAVAGVQSIDQLEVIMRSMPPCTTLTEHIFTPGLYSRKTTMYRGSLITSKIHKHRHPFVILEGKCAVWDKATGWKEYEAPYMGITEPGTRRILLIKEKTVWVTFHVTPETNLENIEQHVIAKTEEECASFLALQRSEQLENKQKDLP